MKTIIFSMLTCFLITSTHANEVSCQPTSETLVVVFLSIVIVVILLLWRRNRVMSAELKMRKEAHTSLSLVHKQMRKQAYTDDLTGMGNRRAFYQQAEAEIKLVGLDKTPLALLLIDIDFFKRVNDRFGHVFGDHAIKKLSDVILKIVRSNDVQGRIGGEEFAILAPNTDLQGAEDLAERIRSATESMELLAGTQTVKLTVSIGVTAFDLAADNLNSVMERADKGLYQAKRFGRNQVVIRQTSP